MLPPPAVRPLSLGGHAPVPQPDHALRLRAGGSEAAALVSREPLALAGLLAGRLIPVSALPAVPACRALAARVVVVVAQLLIRV